MTWVLYILVITVSGITPTPIQFHDEKSCKDMQRELGLVMSTVAINPHPVTVQACMPLGEPPPSPPQSDDHDRG